MYQQKTKKACRILSTSTGSFQTIKPLKTNKIKIFFPLKLFRIGMSETGRVINKLRRLLIVQSNGHRQTVIYFVVNV